MSRTYFTSAAPAAMIDVLNGLLEAELGSIFTFLDAGSPYLSRAGAEIRQPLNQMIQAGQRHAVELAAMIDELGGVPAGRQVQPDEQYLAFLTLKFLLPKLAQAKQLMIERYENALRAMSAAPPRVLGLVESHLAEHRADLAILQIAKV